MYRYSLKHLVYYIGQYRKSMGIDLDEAIDIYHAKRFIRKKRTNIDEYLAEEFGEGERDGIKD